MSEFTDVWVFLKSEVFPLKVLITFPVLVVAIDEELLVFLGLLVHLLALKDLMELLGQNIKITGEGAE